MFDLNSKISQTRKILIRYSILMALGLIAFVLIISLTKAKLISIDAAMLLVAGLVVLFFLLTKPKNETPPEKEVSLKILSQRENEVAKLLAQGKDNKTIAEELFISENTVKTHIKKIYHKLEVNNRTQFTKRYLTSKHHPNG